MNCRPAPIVLISQDASAIPFPPIEWTCARNILVKKSAKQYSNRTRNPGDSIYDLQKALKPTELTGK
jgi:hypothetical protein